MKYSDRFQALCEALEGPGAFLVVEDGKGRVNAMTIGWAQVGVVWGEPILTVLVRPARHTHTMLQTAKGFTVCVPKSGELKKELAYCGSKSGREYDKIRACGLKLSDGAAAGLKVIGGCGLVYHCEMYGTAQLRRESTAAPALGKYYPGADAPHTLFFGRIIKTEERA